jgi:hypothetical protein
MSQYIVSKLCVDLPKVSLFSVDSVSLLYPAQPESLDTVYTVIKEPFESSEEYMLSRPAFQELFAREIVALQDLVWQVPLEIERSKAVQVSISDYVLLLLEYTMYSKFYSVTNTNSIAFYTILFNVISNHVAV